MENQSGEHHYFVSTGVGWATATNRDEAIKKLVSGYLRDMKHAILGAHRIGEIGAYVWSCRVMEPETAKYRINFFKPEGVEITEGREHYITHATSRNIAYHTIPQDE